ncbi:unnamed protein product [Gulo gulo]|uniref:Uncharacterized protein n=1 Tax=Gulo gulo TaxID=48420 RepID=A0A9X9LC32_GULGU|nr:unnamed protein product [Gulo gulo]
MIVESKQQHRHEALRSGLSCLGPNPALSFARHDVWASCDISLHLNFLVCQMRREIEK